MKCVRTFPMPFQLLWNCVISTLVPKRCIHPGTRHVSTLPTKEKLNLLLSHFLKKILCLSNFSLVLPFYNVSLISYLWEAQFCREMKPLHPTSLKLVLLPPSILLSNRRSCTLRQKSYLLHLLHLHHPSRMTYFFNPWVKITHLIPPLGHQDLRYKDKILLTL